MSVSIANGVSATVNVIPTTLPEGISPTTSPMTIQNTTSSNIEIFVSGGIVTAIQFSRDGTTWVSCGITSGMCLLNPRDYVRITYSVSPTITRVIR